MVRPLLLLALTTLCAQAARRAESGKRTQEVVGRFPTNIEAEVLDLQRHLRVAARIIAGWPRSLGAPASLPAGGGKNVGRDAGAHRGQTRL